MKRIIKYFLKGLLIFIPVVFTTLAIVWVFTELDSLLGRLFSISIPGLGLLLTVITITAIGFFASNFVGKKLFALLDATFKKLPLVKLLYSAIKDMIEAFAGEKKSFDKPVIVELTPAGPKAMGFVTQQSLDFLGLHDHVSVYFPQSYNFAGSVLIFPANQVKPLEVDSADAMTFIVSGGVSGK